MFKFEWLQVFLHPDSPTTRDTQPGSQWEASLVANAPLPLGALKDASDMPPLGHLLLHAVVSWPLQPPGCLKELPAGSWGDSSGVGSRMVERPHLYHLSPGR